MPSRHRAITGRILQFVSLHLLLQSTRKPQKRNPTAYSNLQNSYVFQPALSLTITEACLQCAAPKVHVMMICFPIVGLTKLILTSSVLF